MAETTRSDNGSTTVPAVDFDHSADVASHTNVSAPFSTLRDIGHSTVMASFISRP